LHTSGRIDWEGVEHSPELRELVARRRRFVVPAGIFFMTFFVTYLLLAALAKDFMATDVGGVPLGWLLAMAQVFMAWGVAWLYLRFATRALEPLERRAAARALAEEVDR
jgi:uncharacterized membrane protein (DUF485 family)